MGKKLIHDLRKSEAPFRISENHYPEKLTHYYLLFEEDPATLNLSIATLDENGIPLNKAYIDVENAEDFYYYPISIGQFGLALFHSYLTTRSTKKKTHFLNIADWFVQNHQEDTKIGVYWLSDVPKPEYKVFEPWKSAFAQSRALSILLRAWQVTANEKYYKIAAQALRPFTYDISDGGVAAFQKEGHPFYEEYVASAPTMVLDGHIFSLFGLYDFIRAVPDTTDKKYHQLARKLFDAGIHGLKYWWPRFDLGFWLRFNFCRMDHYPDIDPCSIGYLRLVKSQLKVLYQITGDVFFKEQNAQVHRYDRWYNIIRMYGLKFRALKNLNRI